jgi:hypothetical protein
MNIAEGNSMKQYVIDQLRESDYHRIADYLKENLECTALDGIYWMNLPEHLYGETQRQHTECQPFYFAVSLDRTQVAFEWLIRSRQALRCSCLAYANAQQREHIIHFADAMLEKLNIRV